jgi:hypothetical protein
MSFQNLDQNFCFEKGLRKMKFDCKNFTFQRLNDFKSFSKLALFNFKKNGATLCLQIKMSLESLT